VYLQVYSLDMIYRFNMKKSPRSIIVILLSFIFALGAFISLLYLQFPWNVIFAALSVFFSIFFWKTTKKQKQSHIQTHDEGISGITGFGEKISLDWSTISHQGIWNTKPRTLFLYSEEDDQLLVIPDEYTQFDQLLADIQKRFTLKELGRDDISSVHEYLKNQMNTEV